MCRGQKTNQLIYKSLGLDEAAWVGEGNARVAATRVVIVDIVEEEWRGDEDCESGDDGDFMAHWDNNSIGNGKMMVEFFSALMELRVWR